MRARLVPLILLGGCAEPKGRLVIPSDDESVEVPSGSEFIDADGDGYATDADCDDAVAAINPGAQEKCNGVDDDCDSFVDAEAADAARWYADSDGDGHGDPATARDACEQPAAMVASADDCDDTRAEVSPLRAELCATEWDDDCDGAVNEDDAADVTMWSPDLDGDGYGDGVGDTVVACGGPAGWVADFRDCDDADAAIHPGARDVCNDGVDQDCDGAARRCPYSGPFTVGEAVVTYVGAGLPQTPRAIRMGDVNGDGEADFLAGYQQRLVIDTSVASRSGEVGLYSLPIYVESEFARDGFGFGVYGGRDFDADGLPDLLVGADGDDGTADDAGRVYVFAGPLEGRITTEDAYASFGGEATDDVLSRLVGGADLNGDGLDDLFCGTSSADDDAGAVYVSWGPVGDGADSVEAADVTLRGAPSSAFGADASTADLDGDGYVDLVVGAANDGSYGEGSVHLFSGASLSVARGEGAVADALVSGGGGLFGESADVEGDADASGRADLLVSASLWGTGFDVPGRTYVFYDVGLSSRDVADADVVLTGEGTSTYSGASWIGDINADGYDDALLSAWGVSVGGRGYLFYGPISGGLSWHAEADATIDGPTGSGLGGGLFQTERYGAGDFDADGVADFLLPGGSLTADNGRIWLFRGAAGP